jgi:RimJ/RimL family protein N-acetyltransferase
VRGDLVKWKETFRKEITHPATYHITFGWDSPSGELGCAEEFLEDGFTLAQSVVLTVSKVTRPPRFNTEIIVSPVTSEEDFEASIQIQIACSGEDLSKEAWEKFYRKQMTLYRHISDIGKGAWFGAYLNHKLVGCLGIFSEDDLGRYQIVSTHPNHQRQGVCASLVYKTAQYAFERMKLKKLVMVADEHYHAAKIYESVGFVPTEKMVGVSWHDKSRT